MHKSRDCFYVKLLNCFGRWQSVQIEGLFLREVAELRGRIAQIEGLFLREVDELRGRGRIAQIERAFLR